MALADISFATNDKDFDLISKIIRRISMLRTEGKQHLDGTFEEFDIPYVRTEFRMDITAVHCNGCPLNLQKLLDFDDFNFLHDVYGISRHVNRETGELKDSFLPRCAMPQSSRDAT